MARKGEESRPAILALVDKAWGHQGEAHTGGVDQTQESLKAKTMSAGDIAPELQSGTYGGSTKSPGRSLSGSKRSGKIASSKAKSKPSKPTPKPKGKP
tara:strand:+ start:311 stop:604 length:294 start_codon:yes stop_codon:yes gene_type:complete